MKCYLTIKHKLPIRYLKNLKRTSLLVQGLRICLTMQETRVQPLVQEDATRRRATQPMSHIY